MPPPSIYGKMIGLDNLRAGLEGLSRKVAGPIARKAVDAAVQPILTAARGNAPQRTGALRRSIGYVVRTYYASRVTVGVVGVVRDYQEGDRRPMRYARMVEEGRPEVRIKHKRVLSDGTTIYGTRSGPIPGQFYLRRAHEDNHATTLAMMARVVAAELAATRSQTVPVPGS